MCESSSDMGLRAACIVCESQEINESRPKKPIHGIDDKSAVSSDDKKVTQNALTAIIPSIISQHNDEASFLWVTRNRAVLRPQYLLADIVSLDDRVDAHLDGLKIAGDKAWQMAENSLSDGLAGGLFVASILAFESGRDNWISVVLDAAVKPEMSSGEVVCALGWMPYDRAAPHIERFLTSDSATLLRVGIAACAIQRRDPGQQLTKVLRQNESLLTARALEALGELGRKDLLSLVKSHFNAQDEQCRFAAAWSGALLGDSAAVPILKILGESGGSNGPKAFAMAFRRMTLAHAHDWHRKLASRLDTQLLAIIGAGILGDPALIPWLIEQMTIPGFMRVAGESFVMITGIDLTKDHLEGKKPNGFEAGPTEDPNDENVEMDPDEDLPWPNVDLIQKWWHTHRLEFQNGTRYLLGKPMTIDWLKEVLKIGRQRQRTAAAIELAMRQPGTPLFNTHAPGFRQIEMLKSI